MPAPTNISAATATDLGTLPASVTQDVHDADTGTTYTVWYQHVATVDDVIGAFGFGDLSVYRPTVDVFKGDPGAPVPHLNISVENKPIQFPVEAGETYYLRFTPNAGNPTPAVLLLEVERAPASAAPSGSIFVNDDTAGFPAAVLSPTTGEVLQFAGPAFPNGEAGDVLTSGRFLIEDAFTDELKLYDDTFTLLATLAFAGGDPRIRTNRGAQAFYVGRNSNPVIVRKVTSDGAFDPTTWTLTGITSLLGFATSNDETIAYHADLASGSAIKRWDLVNLVALSDLVAGVAGRWIPDILVLGDDSIVANYVQNVLGTLDTRRYDPSGTLLNTYATPSSTFLPAGTFPRLAYAADDPNSFWIWTHLESPNVGISRFQNIKVSDGSILATLDVPEYELGIYQHDETATPLARFGISFSCPFFVFPLALAGGGGGGVAGVIGPLVWWHFQYREVA